MSHSSIQPIPADRPVADSRVCPFCLRSVYSLREGKGHRYPCPCIDIERVSDRWNQYAVEAREDAEQDREAADTPSVQGGGPNPLARMGSARGRSPEPLTASTPREMSTRGQSGPNRPAEPVEAVTSVGGFGGYGTPDAQQATPEPDPRWQDIDNPFWVEEF